MNERWMRTVLGALLPLAFAACSHRAPTPPLAPVTDGDGGASALYQGTARFGGSASTRATAVSGGNVLALSSGLVAVAHAAADAVVIVDPDVGPIGGVDLGDDAEPGRLVEDASGLVHVVLRRAGELVTIDPIAAVEVDRRRVCGAPRGLAYDREADDLYVACAGGELVTLHAAQGGPTRAVDLGPDLRDVVVADGRLYVSRFRSAELLTVDADGRVVEVRRPSVRSEVDSSGAAVRMEPGVAYRLRAMPDGGVVMLHQRAFAPSGGGSTSGGGGGYYGGPAATDTADRFSGAGGTRIGACTTGIVQSAIAIFGPHGSPTESGPFAEPALAVDLAVSDDGARFYTVSAAGPSDDSESTVRSFPRARLAEPCLQSDGSRRTVIGLGVEALPDGRVVMLERDAGALRLMASHLAGLGRVGLGVRVAPSSGSDVFHEMTPSRLACASCHPEGGDDGHVWTLANGRRRTQSLLGGIIDTAPFHWDGDQPDMRHVMALTMDERMGGSATSAQVASLSSWLNALPTPSHDEADADSVRRGRGIFERVSGCSTCHAGAALTNDHNVDVGTGGAFQVPSLRGVGTRAPYFHDGCAPSLEAVLGGACGSDGHHGRASTLSTRDRADLLTYLRSL